MVIDLPLSSWQPDNPSMNNPGLTVARNVVPALGLQQGMVTYGPAKRAALFANSSLSSRPLGVFVGTDRDDTIRVYAGTSTDLSEFNTSTSQWMPVTRASTPYSTTEDENWNFIQYNNLVIGTNYNDYPQFVVPGTATKFDNLTELVRGRYLAQHKGFAILANTSDEIDGNVPYRVRWSALDNPTLWDFDPSYQSDFQDVQDVGPINSVVVDEDVYLLCKDAIVRMHYAGTPWIYTFDNVVNGKGCAFAKSVVTVEGTTYFLDDDGFYSFRRGDVKPIGLGKVNDYFYSIFDSSQAAKMTTTVDPKKTLINWTFVSNSATNGVPDVTLVYNYLTGDWSQVDATAPYLYQARTLSWTIEQLSDVYLTFENVPASWDSPIWAGGNSILWGMDDAGKIYTLSGDNLPAIFETREMQLTAGNNSRMDNAVVLGVRPIFEGEGAANIALGKKQIANSQIAWGVSKPVNAETGFAYLRDRSRYQKVRWTLAGEWDKASMMQIDFVPAGGR